jgi:hypothetical protein
MSAHPTDIIDIGPECFAAADGSVICWRGQNYTPQRIGLRVRLHNLVVGFRNRRIDAQSRRNHSLEDS